LKSAGDKISRRMLKGLEIRKKNLIARLKSLEHDMLESIKRQRHRL
jgi:hypothetical protein